MPLDPTLPEMVEDPLLRRLLMLEDRLSRLEQSNPLVRAQVNDDEGRKRLRIGYLDPSSDAAGFGMEIFDTSGASVLKATETGIVSGGQVRALEVASLATQVQNVSLTTSNQQLMQLSFARPSWATVAIVIANSMGQISETTKKDLIMYTYRNGTTSGVIAQSSVQAGSNLAITAPHNFQINSPGATVTVETVAKVDTGTNTSNLFTLNATIFWLK